MIDGEQGGFNDRRPAAEAGETRHEVATEVQLFNDGGCNPVQQYVQAD